MQSEVVVSGGSIAWGAAGRALPGQAVSGDLHLVEPTEDGFLIAVVDGIGHGSEAAAAAGIVIDMLRNYAEEPAVTLVKRCHDALTYARGAVMTVATLHPNDGRLTLLGVGNVEAVMFRESGQGKVPIHRAVLRGGIVGYQLPRLQTQKLRAAPGDLIVFATDGIGAGFTECVAPGGTPQQIAERILERHFKGTDDALALAVLVLD